MDALPKEIRNLCTPALACLILSAVSFLAVLGQNIADSRRFCLGKLSCQVPHVSFVLAAKLLYIAFWTWAINALCKSGHPKMAWALLFLPIIAFFVLASLMVFIVSLEEGKKQ